MHIGPPGASPAYFLKSLIMRDMAESSGHDSEAAPPWRPRCLSNSGRDPNTVSHSSQ